MCVCVCERERVFLCVCVCPAAERFIYLFFCLGSLDKLPETERERRKQIASEREGEGKEDRKVTVISEL